MVLLLVLLFMKTAALLLLLASAATATATATSPASSGSSSASSDAAEVSAESALCSLRHALPAKNTQPLVFCNWYRHESCCLPAHDAEISGYFHALVDAGDSCAKFQNRAKYFLSVAACFGCDPDEPRHVSAPLDPAFFIAAGQTLKVCASVASRMAPALFADCGLTLPDDRSTACSPNSAIVPAFVWPDCADAQFVCQDQTSLEWACSDAPCADGHTPPGFANAPCNASEHTCTGALKFLNDNRAAKPVNYEALPVEIVDEARCLRTFEGDAARCKCLRAPSSGARRQRQQSALAVAASVGLAILTVWN